MKQYLRSLLDRYFGTVVRKEDLENFHRQIACLIELQTAIVGPVPFGRLGGWAISADALAVVVREIRTHRNPRIVEFGSGVSTVALAALLKTIGGGTLTTIEHDPVYLESAARELTSLNLDEFVTLVHLPLVEYLPGMTFPPCQSYDLRQLDVAFDIALVDGPPGTFGVVCRLAPLDWCVSRLCPEGAIFLDDANRTEERQVIEALRAKHDTIRVRDLPAEKGLVRIAYGLD